MSKFQRKLADKMGELKEGKKFVVYSEWLKKEKLPRDKISKQVYERDKKEHKYERNLEQELKTLKDKIKEFLSLTIDPWDAKEIYFELYDKLKELIK